MRNILINQQDSKAKIFFYLEEDALERLRLTQNELNKQGASDLVVELFISQSSMNILEESIHLAIALLEGGNTEVQVRYLFVFDINKASKQWITFRQVSFAVCMDVRPHRKNSFKFFMIKCMSHRRH